MSTLYLLNDLSSSMPWNLAGIHANRVFLAQNGLELAPFDAFNVEALPTHSGLWRVYDFDNPIPPGIAARLDKVLAWLDAGKSALLLNVGLHLPAHRSFARLLKTRPGFEKHGIKSIIAIGRPLVLFEQRWRWAGNIAYKDRLAHARLFANLHRLAETSRHLYGSENVALLADLSDNPKSLRQDELTAQIFAALGCPAPPPLQNLPPHPLIFGSATARRLYNARQVRFNFWPPLNEDAFRSCLLDQDKDWGSHPIAPLELRTRLQTEGAESRQKLEKILGLEAGGLDAPEWLLEDSEESAITPLEMDKVRAFAQALPQAVASPLRQRLEIDARLHWHAHKCLLVGLKSRPEAEFQHIGEPEQPVDLTVLTMTYNHEKFIAQCMDSVLAQQTDFPIRHLVLDHCSSDATPRIVAEYADKHPLIRPVLLNRHARAENCHGLFTRCRTKYAALCDGDDYFIDPLKLRKQVDFLEAHPKSSLVFHPVRVVYENSDQEPGIYPLDGMLSGADKDEYDLDDLIRTNFIQTNSVVYRWRFTEGLPAWFRADLCPGDWYWHLLHAEMGNVGFMPDMMSVYRRHKQALFAGSYDNLREHHRRMGMTELETFHVVDEHFKGRYFSCFSSLTDTVFRNFLRIALAENDKSLLEKACEKYPKFGQHFLNGLKEMEYGEAGKNVKTYITN